MTPLASSPSAPTRERVAAPAGRGPSDGGSAAAPSTRAAGPFKMGYILNPAADLVWFLLLPFGAILIALGCQAWLPFVAVASINLWVTVPHHYASWVRTYGIREEWEKYKDRLIAGPILIIAFAVIGMATAPITLFLVVTAWDHQHSIMQQHGFGRIYDFKAGTGTPDTGRYDLALHWTLYGFMFLHAPLFRHLLIRELYQMHIPVSVAFVQGLMWVSTAALVVVVAMYLWHLRRTVSSGGSLNPMKYAFIGASYFLWYFTAWHTNSVLLFAVAHRIMHGVQYMVIVWAFLGRKAAQAGQAATGLWSRVAGRGRLKWFLLAGGGYALLYQWLLTNPLDEFGFGIVNFAPYQAIPRFGLPGLDASARYALFSAAMVSAFGMWHYYVDSFIWKVRDKQVQKGL
jgi:hypothetical protein